LIKTALSSICFYFLGVFGSFGWKCPKKTYLRLWRIYRRGFLCEIFSNIYPDVFQL